MANTYIETGRLPRTRIPGGGEAAEILNATLCGAKNVVGQLHWLASGDRLDARGDGRHHQLLYIMEGDATISLNGADHPVSQGAGVYLDPSESARISHRGGTVKIFHLSVVRQP
jgi:glyoxylate utilization-related uncharacterized protein